ncbi:uncharacterized protein LOC122643375 [Telopea speciosissima]|uniref:uncharacterized protein LOC122643375 n=1 Tax=Telopea speciosissima TaxID=54955 RepID=UPI001CC73EA8|nr:uncharacterized protein LOC122643375 [Telopea speciosissima]
MDPPEDHLSKSHVEHRVDRLQVDVAEMLQLMAQLVQSVNELSKGGSISGPMEQEVRKTNSATPKTPITILVEEGDDSRPMDPPEIEREKKMREKVAELEVVIKGKVKEKDEEDLLFFLKGRTPEDFKWKLDKFDGSGDPRAHLKIFATIARSWGLSENQMGQAFLYSLAGSALRWLTQLDHTQTQSWASVVKAFTKQYSYNTEMDITRRELETLRQEPSEEFLNYIMRFREKAAKMWNRSTEEEQVNKIHRDVDKIQEMLMRTVVLDDKYQEELQQLEPVKEQWSLPQAIHHLESSINLTLALAQDLCGTPPLSPNRGNREYRSRGERKDRNFYKSLAEARKMYQAALEAFHAVSQLIPEDSHTVQQVAKKQETLSKILDQAQKSIVALSDEGAEIRTCPKGPLIFNDSDEEDGDFYPVKLVIKGRESEVTETRSGQNFKNKDLTVEKYWSSQSTMVVEPENRVLDQLKKAQANILIWGLLMSLFFSEEDLPPGGKNHNRALYIIVECNKNQVPQVLIDNGSVLNVMPLKAARCMGMSLDKMKSSSQTIRAYDNSRREVMGILTTNVKIGPACFTIDFQVIDVQASFNMLLGRPWLHSKGALASSLHQKLKFLHDQKVITIFEDLEMVHTLANIEVDGSISQEVQLGGFKIGHICTSFVNEEDSVLGKFPMMWSKATVRIMKKMKYFPGLGLGKNQQGIPAFPEIQANTNHHGLGFNPKDPKKKAPGRRNSAVNGNPYFKTLNGYFMKVGEDFPYYGNQEPWFDQEQGKRLPGLEIFFRGEVD